MIRKATLADDPRITEVRLAVRENRLDPGKRGKVAEAARWLYDNAGFWV
jgi:hypothetical protein